jgi:hypothetical protein
VDTEGDGKLVAVKQGGRVVGWVHLLWYVWNRWAFSASYLQSRATLPLPGLATCPHNAWPSLAPMPDPRPAIVCTNRGSPEQLLRDCRE